MWFLEKVGCRRLEEIDVEGLKNGLIRLKMLYRNRHYVHTYLPVVRRQLVPIFTVTHRIPDSAARLVFVLGLLEHGSGITF